MPKRRIFISFDHDDTDQVNGFLGLRQILDGFEFFNHKLDRRINSTDAEYVCRVIRDEYIGPASVTVVLIGNRTRAEYENLKRMVINWRLRPCEPIAFHNRFPYCDQRSKSKGRVERCQRFGPGPISDEGTICFVRFPISAIFLL